MSLLGDIVLCSRDAVLDDRHFSGRIAHLSLFSSTLQASQVMSLYNAVPLSNQATDLPAAAPTPTSSWLDQFSSSPYLQASSALAILQRRDHILT